MNHVNSLKDTADHLATLEQRLIVSENEARDYKGLLDTANREIDMLRAQLKRSEDERTRLERWGTDFTTRINVVIENMLTAVKESRKDSLKPLLPHPDEPNRTNDVALRAVMNGIEGMTPNAVPGVVLGKQIQQ